MPHNAIVREIGGIVIDVNDLGREAAFWGELLGQEPGQPRSGGGWLTVGTLEGAAPPVVSNRRQAIHGILPHDGGLPRKTFVSNPASRQIRIRSPMPR